MTSESPQADKSKTLSTNVDSPGQMRGWFKLIETIRKTDPPSTSTELIKPSPNSNTNGHRSKSPSPPPLPISLPPSPIQPEEEEIIPEIIPEPKPKKATKRLTIRHKKITIRKSSRIKTSTIIPDTDIPQRKSINESLTPLATDLHSLPGHNEDDLRDKRFLDYTDMNTLSAHLNTCLSIDKKSFSSSTLTKQHIFKTRHNILNKIFKLHYLKMSSKFNQKTFIDKKEEPKSNLVSSTTISFKTDWSVNRKSTPTTQYEPKNYFHILQQNPKKQIFLSNNSPLIPKISDEKQYEINYEHIKTLLVRTYYPHFHAAMKYGHHFGLKSKIPIKHHDLPVISKPDSPIDFDETMTITLKSPPSITHHESKKRGRRSKHKKLIDKPLPITSTQRRVSEEIPAVMIKESTIISTPPPLSEKQINTNNRKRKTSITIHPNEKKSKRCPSPEYHEISYSDSDEDILPDQLPKQIFIKNGLRSNYYKSIIDTTNTKNRLIRHRRQSSGSLPPFYTGIFQTEDDKLSYIDYQLPFDIYWFSQKQVVSSPSKSIAQNKKKKTVSIPSKRILQQNVLTPEKPQNSNKILLKMEELTEHEKQIVSETSILLKRNLRRIKEKRESKDKNNNQQKQHIDEQPLPLFFAQNYYHPNTTSDFSNLSHKDLLNLFYNHIRRSHFAKIGQCSTELIDSTCYYGQLGQLTLILNDIFDLLLNYKCQNNDIYPSNALKKCPIKRLFPMYYELILKPIDLTIIRNKLDTGEYLSYELFEQDLLLLFKNAITYCGEDSDVGRAVKELQIYFIDILKIQYQPTINLFNNLNENSTNKNNLKDFISHLHQNEIINGQIRQTIYDIIFNIDHTSPPIVYKTIQSNSTNTHRASKNILINDCIVHCRCGSVYDETLLVQCYACQLWQHASCVTITDHTQPYYCFECYPLCEEDPSCCLKTNVQIEIPNDTNSSYSTITRSDGFIVRINESYLITKQEDSSTLSEYDIFFIERLWFDKNHIGQASGFYYLRPYETFHEVNRKFFSNEVFRFPSTNDSIDINSIIRPCYVLDTPTYCKGKPICEYSSRLLNMDLFICEYRVDKLARTFTRLPKSKHIGINTKSYCFDNYVEKLSIKREYQSHQQQSSRRRSIKLTSKQFEEKSSHIDGIIEKIYCHFHHPNLIPTETKFSPNQFFQESPIDRNNNRGRKRLREKNSSSTKIFINKKRRTTSISSNEYIPDNTQHIISSLIDELIELIPSHIV